MFLIKIYYSSLFYCEITPVEVLGSLHKSIGLLLIIVFKEDCHEFFIINVQIVFPDVLIFHMGAIQINFADHMP